MIDKGAHFYRCDLQVHTPRDRNWTGGDRVSDADRRTYASSLVQACRDRGIQGIAITDHHDMAFADYVRQAAAEETNPEGNVPKLFKEPPTYRRVPGDVATFVAVIHEKQELRAK